MLTFSIFNISPEKYNSAIFKAFSFVSAVNNARSPVILHVASNLFFFSYSSSSFICCALQYSCSFLLSLSRINESNSSAASIGSLDDT